MKEKLGRAWALATIAQLYGLPGTDYESATGNALLLEMLAYHGQSAFTDDFLLGLAARHIAEDDSPTTCKRG